MNTVLNIGLTDAKEIKSQPMFLGEPLGLQRYDVVKYPIFRDLYKKQQEFMWRPEEISLKEDRNNYEELTEAQREVFEKNLMFQTMGDSMFSRSIDEIKKYVTNTELEYAMNCWSFMENVHSESYSYVLDNISKSPKEFFDRILKDNEIVYRAKEMKDDFDSLIGLPEEDKSVKEKVFRSILNFQIAEGVMFYVSFACSFWFGSQGIMTGNADIIKLIARDENLHQSITQNIISNWRKNESEGFQKVVKDNEQLIYDTYGMAVENEKRWARYLFAEGSLIGLNPEILGGYSEWLANNRLRSLGYDQIFDTTSNPIGGWLSQYTDSSKVQVAPQERERTAYRKNHIKSDFDDDLEKFEF